MISIGKRKSDDRALTRLLRGPHNIRILVQLLDLDHKYRRNLTSAFIGGAVTVDALADVTRALDLTLFDPGEKIHLDPTSPARTSIFIADMIKVVYVVSNPKRTKVYEVPVFCGPIDKVEREGYRLVVKCIGKESLSLSNNWKGKTYKAKQKKIEVIENLLREQTGETKLSLTNKKAKLPNDVKLNSDKTPWHLARRLAESMGCQLFYDGRGVATLREKPSGKPVKFNANNMTTEPRIAYDLTETINAVRVFGKKPKKNRPKIKYKIVAKRSHPLSPWRLGRGLKPRYLWKEIEDSAIDSRKEAKKVAKRELKAGLMAGVSLSFNGLVEPRLQELDIIYVGLDNFSATAPIKQFVIPLVAGDTSSYGHLGRARPRGGPRPIKRKGNRGNKDNKNNKKGDRE